MKPNRISRPAAHFQRLYDADPDPWRFRTSQYEAEKYRKTIDVLQSARYRSALEIGCSIGVLTRMLAPLCDKLLAVDIIEQPLVTARAACADQPWVDFRQMAVPADWPDQMFDLIVLSEILYFLSPGDIGAVAGRVLGCLRTGGVALLVNWRGNADDPCSGDDAARLFMADTEPFLSPVINFQAEGYRLDKLVRARPDHGRAPYKC